MEKISLAGVRAPSRNLLREAQQIDFGAYGDSTGGQKLLAFIRNHPLTAEFNSRLVEELNRQGISTDTDEREFNQRLHGSLHQHEAAVTLGGFFSVTYPPFHRKLREQGVDLISPVLVCDPATWSPDVPELATDLFLSIYDTHITAVAGKIARREVLSEYDVFEKDRGFAAAAHAAYQILADTADYKNYGLDGTGLLVGGFGTGMERVEAGMRTDHSQDVLYRAFAQEAKANLSVVHQNRAARTDAEGRYCPHADLVEPFGNLAGTTCFAFLDSGSFRQLLTDDAQFVRLIVEQLTARK
ncbi:MAG: hypothetical protein TR69_WS6001001050 [candidate division WS6 bacterium OLB20]|uniref:Uncharacterized protein n=1 Tax=candidate division WS6 bacterium OLB20 TaxID=1617426 RepID=A0A136LZE1_9BACT|nr:MAG: hypothetical protein TR69_WS6001001050 [candidate division WS6 bacterium OLB20]